MTVGSKYYEASKKSKVRFFSYVEKYGEISHFELFFPLEGRRVSDLAYGRVNEKLLAWLGIPAVLLFSVSIAVAGAINFPALLAPDAYWSVQAVLMGVFVLSLLAVLAFGVYCYFVFFYGRREALIIPLNVSGVEKKKLEGLVSSLLESFDDGFYSREKHEKILAEASALAGSKRGKSSRRLFRSVGQLIEMFS